MNILSNALQYCLVIYAVNTFVHHAKIDTLYILDTGFNLTILLATLVKWVYTSSEIFDDLLAGKVLHDSAGVCVGGRIHLILKPASCSQDVVRPHHVRLPHDVVSGQAVGPRSRFGGVREGESGVVDDPVVPHQGDRDLGGLSHPLPSASELGDVWHNTQHTLLREQRFRTEYISHFTYYSEEVRF